LFAYQNYNIGYNTSKHFSNAAKV